MKRIAFLFLFLVIESSLFAQNSIQITSRAGRLANIMKKYSPEQIERLTIDGDLNNTDLLYLCFLPRLVSLDLSHASLSSEYSKSLKEQLSDLFVDQGRIGTDRDLGIFMDSRFILAGFDSLEELSLGEQVKELVFDRNLLKLSIPFYCRLNYEDEGTGAIFMLEIRGEQPRRFKENGKTRSSLRDDRVPWAGFGYGRLQSDEDLKVFVNLLSLPSRGFLIDNRLANWITYVVCPECIRFSDEGTYALNIYEDDLEEYLPLIDYCSDAAFAAAEFSEFTFPEQFERVPSYCFAATKNLSHLTLDGVTSIGSFAFRGSALKELTLPATVEEINADAFNGSNLETIRMNGPAPLVYQWQSDNDGDATRAYVDHIVTNATFIVPSEYRSSYRVGAWADALIAGDGNETEYTLTPAKEGDLKKQLTEDIILNAQRITIKGIMNDLDFGDLQKCKNLRYLDLSQCFTIKSEYTSYLEYQSQKAMLEIAKIKLDGLKEGNEMQYSAGWKSSSEYRMYRDAVKRADQELKNINQMIGEWTPSQACYLPADAFESFPHLNEIRLPRALKKLDARMPHVREVVLPPGLESIGSFCFKDSPLRSIHFPSSLASIGERCFMGCENLKAVDMSDTKVTELTFECFLNSSVSVLKAPRGLKKLYNGESFSRARNALVVGGASLFVPEVFFYTPTPPEGFSGTAGIETIHIPHGFKAGWASKVDMSSTSLVDDIYPDRQSTSLSKTEEKKAQEQENERKPAAEKKRIQKDPALRAIERQFFGLSKDNDVEEGKSGKTEELLSEVTVPSEETVYEPFVKKERRLDKETADVPTANKEKRLDNETVYEGQDLSKDEEAAPLNLHSVIPAGSPHLVLKAEGATLDLQDPAKKLSFGGTIGYYNMGGSRFGGEVGAYLCPSLSSQSCSMYGLDASMVIRLVKDIYSQAGVGFFSCWKGNTGYTPTLGLSFKTGFSVILAGHVCLGLGVKYYPGISVQEVESVLTKPGVSYEFPSLEQVLPGGISPFISVGWAF